ncbi:DUF4157 domain-containing protein [Pseudanabaena sp. ABRG5-3]|uniref:eCIS core domain-containing protein n=1 Tax=Pseudanabaena sp. ABRG5-3 TaxID=685565 RepID=UPI000DC70DCF|nr:DUF4157 domain-containing protein [Pseudanabaena sp. ABRG5-3]BBC27050.1 hypothetical protein ABRG53_d085 [Pseudanabaena sp. ABRG5-3]
MKCNHEKSYQPVTAPKSTTLNLQTRAFAPVQPDSSQANQQSEDSLGESKLSSSENLLEKLISTSSSSPPSTNPIQRKLQYRFPIQAKLNIGEPNDKYEKEADDTAAKVVQQINSSPQGSVQRNESMKSEDEELQMKPAISTIQRNKSMEEEEEEVQMKSSVQSRENIVVGEASTDLESSIQSARSSGQSLDPNLQVKMGQAMGADFSGVKIHTDSQSDQLNKSIQAKAFTTGQDVFFRQGAYEPGSRGGQELIAHELTHVVQQNSGVVKRKVSKVDSGTLVLQREWVEDDGIYMWNKLIDGVTWFAKGPEVMWFNITDSSQIEQGREEDYKLYEGQKKSLQEWQSLRLEVSDVLEEVPPQSEPEIVTRERSNAVVESTLTPEQVKAIQKVRKVPNILKFNFAGSGEEAWKTHKKKYAKPDKEQMGSAEHESGGIKYSKEEHALDKEKLVFEYAGPLGKFMGKPGLVDSGENSTEANLEDAELEFTAYMNKYLEAKDHAPDMEAVQINIKGFSRGAATASVFANWIKSSLYKDMVVINLVLIDPVHGTGKVAKGLMPSEQDVSGIYDEENAPDTSGTTYLMPIKSGHSSDWFTPQKISGYQRLIIGYGPGIKHSFGLGESEDSTLKYEGKPVKGMQLSTLPKGLFVVNAADMNIVKVTSMEMWQSRFEKLVLGKANKKEKRDAVIQDALVALSQYF